MKQESFERFGLALTACAELYGRTLSEGAMALWWQALAEFDIDAVERALRGHVADTDRGQYMPKPADVIRQLRGSTQDAALMAWSSVMEAVRRVGSYSSPGLDKPTRDAVNAVGGWGAVCATQTHELPFLERRFIAAYQAQESAAVRALIDDSTDGPRLLS